MRIPYFDPTAPGLSDEARATVDDLARRRAPGPLLPLDRALLHSLPASRGWNAMLGQIRAHTSLSPALREVVMCRVGVLNRAVFEWEQHCPLALGAGASRRFMRELLVDIPADGAEAGAYRQWVKSLAHLVADFEAEAGEGERVVAAVEYADQMTRGVQVDEGVFARVKQLFNSEEIVDLTVTAGAYNMVSRFLVALDVAERNGTAFADPDDMQPQAPPGGLEDADED